MTPCYEDQVRDKIKIDPLVARSFMDQMMEHLKPKRSVAGAKIDGLSIPDALEAMANQTGLKIPTIAKILQSDSKLRSISKQAFSRQREAGAVKLAARSIAENGVPRTGTILRGYNDLRRLVLAGHSPVFPFTHARNLLYSFKGERQIFGGMVKDAWRFRGAKGDAAHQLAMAEMQKSPNYGLQRSSGLDIEPGLHRGDLLVSPQSGTILSRGMNKLSEMVGKSKLGNFLRLDPANATKSFDALKIGRSKLFDYWWNQQEPALRTEAYAQLLARDMNYATGSVMEPRGAARTRFDNLVSAASKATGDVLLSSKLFYAKRMEAANIFRYGPSRLADLVSKGGKMTAEERAIANIGLKRWARVSATQLGILGANVAFAKAMGLKLSNLTDPSKADFLRMRIGKFVIPLSPLMEVVREPVRAVYAAVQKRSVMEGAKEATRPVVNALTPGFQITGEQITGKEAFSGRSVPSVRNLIQPPKPGKEPPIGIGEYATTRTAPIAISGGLHEFYQALRDEGVEPGMATAFIKGAAGAVTSGLAGTHVYEETPRKTPVGRFREPKEKEPHERSGE